MLIRDRSALSGPMETTRRLTLNSTMHATVASAVGRHRENPPAVAARPACDGVGKRRATGERTLAPAEKLAFDELQIALHIARGATNRDTAVALSLRPGSIEGHLRRIYRKLGLRSRTELSETLRTAIAPTPATVATRARPSMRPLAKSTSPCRRQAAFAAPEHVAVESARSAVAVASTGRADSAVTHTRGLAGFSCESSGACELVPAAGRV